MINIYKIYKYTYNKFLPLIKLFAILTNSFHFKLSMNMGFHVQIKVIYE